MDMTQFLQRTKINLMPFITMKNSTFVFILLVVVWTFAACKKADHAPCIEERIDIFSLEACESDATVKQYTFQNETVYALHLGNCIADGSDEILNADCSTIGFVGGFGGATDINGVNFYDNAMFY